MRAIAHLLDVPSRGVVAALLVLGIGFGTPALATGAAGPRQVFITTTRIHLADVMPDLDVEAGALDLGPAPVAGGSRLITRADILLALDASQVPVPAALPDSVRVVRKAKHLDTEDMNAIVRHAVGSKVMARGVTLTTVRADRPIDVADGWTRVDVDVPRAPKKAGKFTTMAIASFFTGGDVVARVPVPLELAVSDDGATYDTRRGAAVTLIVRRTFIEIRASGFANADADIGDVIPIQLRPSGRVIPARLSSKDEAVALEPGR